MTREPQPIPPGGAPALKFLSDLAAALHVVYLPSDVVELYVSAAARGLGVEIDVFTLQSAVLLQLGRRGVAHLARTEFSPHWNLDRVHQLVTLSERVADRSLALPAARVELDRILAARRRYPKAVVVLGWAVYGATVAARVGGGPVEILAAGLISVLTGAIQFGTLGHPVVDLQKGFLAALVGTLAAFLLGFVLPPFDMGRSVFGAMTLLVPAMVVTVAAYELANEAAAEAGVVRLVYGLLRFVMLGAGTVAALRLWKLFGAAPARAEAVPLPVAAVALAVAVGGVALAAVMQARLSDVPWIVAAVLFAWGVQEATKLAMGGQGSPFVAAFAVAVAGNLFGRLRHKVPPTVVFPALLQLVPGFLGTQAVLSALQPNGLPMRTTFFELQLVSVQLGLGLLVGDVAARPRRAGAPARNEG